MSKDIANLLNLLALLGQVVERLQVLQPNSVLAIPDSHGATEVICGADNRPAPALSAEVEQITITNYF
ncbi:hypothetical protein [Nostoc sp.]